MKTLFGIFFLLAAQFCFGQNPSIVLTPRGLRADSSYFTVAEKRVQGPDFSWGTKVYLNLSGVHGFAMKDGKSFIGCSMKVIDKKNVAIIDYADLFSDYANGVDNEDVRQIHLSLVIGEPMSDGESYRWETRVWDKSTQKDMGIATTIKVIPAVDLLGIKSKSNGLTTKKIFLLGSEPLRDNHIGMGQKVSFVFSGLSGLKANADQKVSLGASMVVKDESGAAMLEMSDLFKDSEPYSLQDAEVIRLYLTTGDPLAAGNTYDWTCKVWDKSTGKSIEASVKVAVVE